MATHALFLGGNRRQWTFPASFYPSCDVTPDQPFEPDYRGSPTVFSINRRFFWNAEANDCNCEGIGQASPGLFDYLSNNPIAVGDVIQAVILPKESLLQGVWVKVVNSCPGTTFDLVVRGNAASLGGTVAVPAPVVIAAAVNAGLPDGASRWIPAPANTYLDQNDMLQLAITGLGPDGIGCSDFIVSPVIQTFCRVGMY